MKIYAKLKIWQKLVIIYLVLVIPVGVLLYLLVKEKHIAIDFALKELDGTAYLRPARDLLQCAYLGLSQFETIQKGTSTPGTAWERNKDRCEKAFNSLEKLDASIGQGLDTGKGFPALREQWLSIKVRGTNLSPAEMDRLLKELIAQGLVLYTHVGDTSNLILDPDLDTFYLMDAIVVKLPEIADLLATVQDLAANSSPGPVDEAIKGNLIMTVGHIKSNIETMRRNLGVAMDNNPARNLRPSIEKTLGEKLAALENYANGIEASIVREGSGVAAKRTGLSNLTGSTAKILEEVSSLWDLLAGNLDNMLRLRIDNLRNKEYKALLFVILVLLLATLLVVLAILGINKSVSSIVHTLKNLNNDLTKEIPVISGDEIGELASIFNEHLSNMNKLLTIVKRSVDDINNSSGAIMAEIEQQSGIITQQSAAASEITATMEELNNSSRQIDEYSHRVAETADGSLENTLNGKSSMENVLKNMEQIIGDNSNNIKEIVALGKESKEIAKIMEIINNIADNSKLIAFNAALEASGAGEGGRRFGIVAIEVRRLAENVMQSIEEIDTKTNGIQKLVNKLVIASEKGSKNIHNGMDTTRSTYSLLSRIVDESQSVASSSRQISISTSQQRTAVEQTLQSIREIDEGIKVASKSIDHITQSVRCLSEFAKAQESVVDSFKIKEA
ncbi:MAG: methyl-accepting chemotaxis protein [Nitrospirae bacterium]|nr:methyl-accepting chemotaxis protein [Nitrospirota bacterium]